MSNPRLYPRSRWDPGCEMELFQPRKSGNADCTFCLDCVHACPHENVGILIERPAKALWTDPVRSGVGQLGRRLDLAVVVLVIIFGAIANAAGMVGPVVKWQEQVQSVLGHCSPALIISLYYLLVLVVLPALAVAFVAAISRWWGQLGENWLSIAVRFSYSLIPLGFGIWLAHYSFHFLGSYETVVPVMQRFVSNLGFPKVGEPQWNLACCRPVADWLPRLEIVYLDFGLLLSLYTGYRIASQPVPSAIASYKSVPPVGGVDRAVVCDRRLDRPPTDANARHHIGRLMMTVESNNADNQDHFDLELTSDRSLR